MPANKFGAASPSLLARLLEDISPRRCAPDYDDEDDGGLDSLRLRDLGMDNAMELSPLEEDSGETFSSPENVNADALGIDQDDAIPEPSFFALDRPGELPTARAATADANDDGCNAGVADDDEVALQQSVKGLFALWRLNRVRKGLPAEKLDFMNVVRCAVGL